MGVILFIMVTGTLPFLKEANIKDNLYQHIKAKNPEVFWQTWKEYFKNRSG
jgi:serine/threonine protein kinase